MFSDVTLSIPLSYIYDKHSYEMRSEGLNLKKKREPLELLMYTIIAIHVSVYYLYYKLKLLQIVL